MANNYVAFLLNVIATTGRLGQAVAADRDVVVARCCANGVKEEDCLKLSLPTPIPKETIETIVGRHNLQ